MQQNEKLAALKKILGNEAFKKNDELVFFCKNPQGCAGKHHNAKLSVNIKSDEYHCWVCGWSGKSLAGILKLGDRGIFLRYVEEAKGKKNDNGGRVQNNVRYTPVSLPQEFRSLSKNVHDLHRGSAIEYLKSRGIDERDILRYKLGYCSDGDFRFRIIIPSFDAQGDLNFFVGRKFYDNAGVSYRHGEFDKNIIFNDYLIDWDRPVVLVEGPFDMMIAGDNAIPLQGTEFPDKLFSKIVMSGIPVYMALDVDAKKKQLKHTEKLMSYGVDVYHVPITDYGAADVGEMTKEQFQLAKKNAMRVKDDIDLLKIRVTA